jgi:hypothetical protein
MGGVVRIRHLDRGDLEAAPLQFQCLLAGTGSNFQDARAGRKERGNLVDFHDSDRVEMLKNTAEPNRPAGTCWTGSVVDRFGRRQA